MTDRSLECRIARSKALQGRLESLGSWSPWVKCPVERVSSRECHSHCQCSSSQLCFWKGVREMPRLIRAGPPHSGRRTSGKTSLMRWHPSSLKMSCYCYYRSNTQHKSIQTLWKYSRQEWEVPQWPPSQQSQVWAERPALTHSLPVAVSFVIATPLLSQCVQNKSRNEKPT